MKFTIDTASWNCDDSAPCEKSIFRRWRMAC